MDRNEDSTVLRPLQRLHDPQAPPLEVTFPTGDGGDQSLRFTHAFRIGRDPSCEVSLKDDGVSRLHAEVRFEEGCWHIHDLQSSNGVYFNGQRTEKAPITSAGYAQLGHSGPILRFSIAGGDKTKLVVAPEPLQAIYQRYLDPTYSGKLGQRTMLVRRAIQLAAQSHARRYWAAIASIALMLIVAIGVVTYQHVRLQRVRDLTVDIFYSMKELELQVADLQERMRLTAAATLHKELVAKKDKLEEMQARYDALLREAGLISPHLGEEEKAIFYIARIFGECELNIPARFVEKVKEYIEKWRSTDRLTNAIARANGEGYVPHVVRTLAEHDLPAQFFYLALQESNYNEKAVGPSTQFGIAKGIWQFIPATANQYGLRTGPLAHLPRYDPQDERFHFTKATKAAAKYLKYMYSTEAQASGLLVIASYNWGDSRVRQLVRKMPQNPRERNFWELLNRYKIPKETYDYVFYIISAAVIGENPALFGFDFNDPLQSALGRK